ncbi:hypothetical protein SCLCIDRAFT_205437 [Scleroderma citrinum Foug A]|uniref:F-box domain-containing protein n=1 Tax=Scleroderma citrinum Foug A TaxID=1036808 RepID=A0A0C3DL33_9AGAM|nr:hypothetical protein SCLCIDRAFT_205437 [Scleroderma citrinum Foug A]
MDEARVELALLEEKAQQLLKQLLDVRAAIVTQRAKIDALSRTSLRQSTFDHLPTEILVFILDLSVRTDYRPERWRQKLGVYVGAGALSYYKPHASGQPSMCHPTPLGYTSIWKGAAEPSLTLSSNVHHSLHRSILNFS